MIRQDELILAGKILKTHGVKGELLFQFDIQGVEPVITTCIICTIDGLFVPFFIDSVRVKSTNTFIVKLNNIETEERAKNMANLDFYLSKQFISQYEKENSLPLSWRQLIGFTIMDEYLGVLGQITAIDDSTLNVLFRVSGESGREILIPASEDFIIDIDDEQRFITVSLPEGLTEI